MSDTEAFISDLPLKTNPAPTDLIEAEDASGNSYHFHVSTLLDRIEGVAALRLLQPENGGRYWLNYHTTPGDGGHGSFRGVTGAAPATYVDNGGTIIVPTGGDGSAAFLREYSGAVNVRWGGAKGDGVTDDTVAIQAAIDSLGGQQGTVFFGPGNWLVTGPLYVRNHNQKIIGSGSRSTYIQFEPTVAATCFTFDEGTMSISSCSLQGFGFKSANTTVVKTGINLVAASEPILHDIVFFPWTDATNSCVGLQINGHEAGSVNHLRISADKPIVIGSNPYGTIDLDHWHFSDLHLIANANPCITINDGVNLTNATFDGYQAWVRGTYGLFWNDTTSTSTSNTLVLKNIRTEQGTVITNESIRIVHNTGLQHLRIENAQFETTRPGLYCRKVKKVSLVDSTHAPVASKVSLDITALDASYVLDIRNCQWTSFSTKILTGFTLRESAYQENTSGGYAPPPTTGVYVYDSPPGSVKAFRESNGVFRWVWRGDIADAASIMLPSTGGLIFTGKTKDGIVQITAHNKTALTHEYGTVYEWQQNATAAAAVAVNASTNFVAATSGSGAAGKLTYVNSGGGGATALYNRTGNALSVLIVAEFTLDSAL